MKSKAVMFGKINNMMAGYVGDLVKGRKRQRYKSLLAPGKRGKALQLEQVNKKAERAKTFKRMQTTRLPAKNRSNKTVTKSVTVKEKAQHYGLGGIKVTQKNKDEKMFINDENIIKKNGKTIKQSELKTMERKSVIASNKLPLISKKGKKKKKIRRKKSKTPKKSGKSQPKKASLGKGVAVKRGSYLLKKNLSAEPKEPQAKAGETLALPRAQGASEEEFESYNVNENFSSKDNNLPAQSGEGSALKTMESAKDTGAGTDAGSPLSNAGLLLGQAPTDAEAAEAKSRKKSVTFDMVRTGTFKEKFKGSPKRKLKSNLRASKFANKLIPEDIEAEAREAEEPPRVGLGGGIPLTSIDLDALSKKQSGKDWHGRPGKAAQSMMERWKEDGPTAEAQAEGARKGEGQPGVKPEAAPGEKMEVEERTWANRGTVQHFQDFEFEGRVGSSRDNKGKEAKHSPPKLFEVAHQNSETHSKRTSKRSLKAGQPENLLVPSGAFAREGGGARGTRGGAQGTRGGTPPRKSFHVEQLGNEAYSRKASNRVLALSQGEGAKAGRGFPRKSFKLEQQGPSVFDGNPRQAKAGKRESGFGREGRPGEAGSSLVGRKEALLSPGRVSETFPEMLRGLSVPGKEELAKEPGRPPRESEELGGSQLDSEEVLCKANYGEQLKRNRSASRQSKAKSFNETMNNIYDDMDKTFDFIEFEGASRESGDAAPRGRERRRSKGAAQPNNILGALDEESPRTVQNLIVNLNMILPPEGKAKRPAQSQPNERLKAPPAKSPETLATPKTVSVPKSPKRRAKLYSGPRRVLESGRRHQFTFERNLGRKILDQHSKAIPVRKFSTNVTKAGAQEMPRPPPPRNAQAKYWSTLPLNQKVSRRSIRTAKNGTFGFARRGRSPHTRNLRLDSATGGAWRAQAPEQRALRLHREPHMFDSVYERMSKSVPRGISAEKPSQTIYVKSHRAPQSQMFQKNEPSGAETVKSFRSNLSNWKTGHSGSGPEFAFAGPQFRTLDNFRSVPKNVLPIWWGNPGANSAWKWGTREAPAEPAGLPKGMVLLGKNNAFCVEDMENRLVQLFLKMLVYSSKIESIKEKLFRGNPDFSSFSLFSEFTGGKRAMLSVEDFGQMLHSFGFGLARVMCQRLMLFLTKYRYTHTHHKIRSQTSFPQSSTQLQTLLSPNDQVDPLTFSTSIANLDTSKNALGNAASCTLPDANFKESQQNLPLPVQGPQVHLNFEDFRELFERLNAPAVRPAAPATLRGVALKPMQYHLIRQILILLLRKLEDVGSIVRSLQAYGSLEIFRYLLKFSPTWTRALQKQSSFSPSQSPRHLEGSIPSNSFHSPANSTPRAGRAKKARPNSITKFMRRRLSKQSRAKILGKAEFSEESEDDLIVGFESPVEVRANQQASPQSMGTPAELTRDDLNNFSEAELRALARRLMKKRKVVDAETVRNFLEFHRVRHLPKDLTFIMSDLGTRSMEIGLEMFDRFIFSDLWSI